MLPKKTTCLEKNGDSGCLQLTTCLINTFVQLGNTRFEMSSTTPFYLLGFKQTNMYLKGRDNIFVFAKQWQVNAIWF